MVLPETEIEVLGIVVNLHGQVLGIKYLPRVVFVTRERHVEHGVQGFGAAEELEIPVLLQFEAAALFAERFQCCFLLFVTRCLSTCAPYYG